MIYEQVADHEPLRQGDFFKQLPRVDLSLRELSVVARRGMGGDMDIEAMSWPEALEDSEVAETKDENGESTRLVRALLPVTTVSAIIVTQDCDAVRAGDISLCEITRLTSVHKGSAEYSSPKTWAKFLTQNSGDHIRWLYLPVDPAFGFSERMAADFRSIIRLPLPELENLKRYRVGRLKELAREHFREKVAHFFRRYAYDPWYPLTKAEFDAYAAGYKDPLDSPRPFPWQEAAK